MAISALHNTDKDGLHFCRCDRIFDKKKKKASFRRRAYIWPSFQWDKEFMKVGEGVAARGCGQSGRQETTRSHFIPTQEAESQNRK